MKVRAFTFFALFSLSLIPCYSPQLAKADEVCRPCPFDCRVLGIGKKDCSLRPYRQGLCCVDLDEDGKDRLRELDHRYGNNNQRCGGDRSHDWNDNRDHDWNDDRDHGWNDNRDHNWHDQNCGARPRDNDNGNHWGWNRDPRRNDPGAYDDRNGYQPGDCPRGYHVNDRMCTKEEAARGCRDYRSPSGKTCVGWNVR